MEQGHGDSLQKYQKGIGGSSITLTPSTTSLNTDASDQAAGAVLQQLVNGIWVPLAFFSKKLRPPEKKYSAFDCELLALYLGVRHFRYFLEGRLFTAFTDLKPLTFCMSKTSEPWSGHQQCQLSYIFKFTTDIHHLQGKINLVADMLSSPTIADVQLGIDYCAMASAQQQNVEVQAYRSASSNLQLEDISFGTQRVPLLSTGHARPIVPVGWKRQVFDIIHSLSHPSIRTTKKLIAAKKGLQKQVGQVVHLLSIIQDPHTC